MTTDLMKRDDDVVAAQFKTMSTIASFDDLQRFASAAMTSQLFTSVMDNGDKRILMAQAMMKIQTGMELGVPPTVALRDIYVIKGRISMSAHLINALIKRAGYRIKSNCTKDAVEMTIADKEGNEHTCSYTIEEARDGGLTSNPSWKKFQSDMLWARCISRAARRFCAEVFLGGVYTPEELRSDKPVEEIEEEHGSHRL